MGWFRSRDSRSDPAAAPSWASFFSPREYSLFIRLVRAALERRRLLFEIGDGQVRVYEPVETILGLANLAQQCHAVDQSGWSALINHHVLVTITAMTENVPLSPDGAESSVRLRLMDVDIAASYELVTRPAMPGTVAALFVDRPDAVESVNTAMVEAWGLPLERLFSLAAENTRQHELGERTTVTIGEQIEAEMLFGPSLFLATHALWPAEWLADQLDPRSGYNHGVLLACPTRHVVFAHVVRDLSVVQAIPALSAVCAERYRQGPGSLLRTLWWWRDGLAHHVDVEVADREVVRADKQLTAWLNQLAPGEKQ